MKFIGSAVQGIAASDAGKYTRKVMRINERQALIDGVAIGDRIRAEARTRIGQQISEQGNSGFVPLEGSAFDAVRESAVNAETDILLARRGKQMEAIGFKAQGDLAYAQGYSAMSGAMINGAASLMDDMAKMGGGG